MYKLVAGNVTYPAGFTAAGVHAGIKRSNEDLALVYSELPGAAAGVFTANRVKAAPVVYTQRLLRRHELQAVVINSGNANACTGPEGYEHAAQMGREAARALGISRRLVAVASTGVIGVPLPIARVCRGIQTARSGLSPAGGEAAARAIMTTDTFPKTAAAHLEVDGRTVAVGGMAKGSGMIHPQLATTLAVVTTDAGIDGVTLAGLLRRAATSTFNMITVDGDTSTNDMVLVVANGASGVRLQPGGAGLASFAAMLEAVMGELARQVVHDGEGASRFIEVRVNGARTEADARRAARAVAGSNLVKTAVFGVDGNWGRVLCALGYSGARFDPAQVHLNICGLPVLAAGTPTDYSEAQLHELMSAPTIVIEADLKAGPGQATAWGCDLTYDYVRINASYRS